LYLFLIALPALILLFAFAIFLLISLALSLLQRRTDGQSTTVRTLLSFVNDTTRTKFVLAVDAAQVCDTLQWDVAKVDAAGGVQSYVHAHETNVLE
jgi:hypothetical protein